MAVSRSLRRLLHIRDIEEEQSRQALEFALGEVNRLEGARTLMVEREHRGRRLIESSARTDQLADRIAGIEETRSASLHAAAIGPRIEAGKEQVLARRQEFLIKRVERRQAETLIQETEAREAVEAGRHGQQSLDDWYNARRFGKRANTGLPGPAKEDASAQAPSTSESPAKTESGGVDQR
jgi:hypothetical protein